MYAMKSSATGGNDAMRYFTYTLNNGETSGHTTEMVEENAGSMTDSGNLYAHIFKLPQGTYCLGAGGGSSSTNVYFLCVQGQTDANIGDNTQAAVGNAITDVDFLLEPPTYELYCNTVAEPPSSPALSKAEFSFKSNFNLLTNKIFEVDIKTIDDNKYLNLKFTENPDFVTYLLLLSRSNEHVYYLNNNYYDRPTNVYIQP